MKKIYLKAYSQNNLGDDLFIHILCQRYPMHTFIMPCSRHYSKAFKHLPNLKTISMIPFIDGLLHRWNLPFRPKRAYYRRIMRQCDATVHVGGSLFIESLFPLSEIVQYEKDVQASQEYYLLGLNFGPFAHKEFFLRMREVFVKLDDICFREQYSYELFDDLPQARLAPDIVFGLDLSTAGLAGLAGEPAADHIVISVIDLKSRPELKQYQSAYEAKIVEICERALAADLRVTLMSFCEYELDEAAIRRINEQLGGRAQAYCYRDNLEEALAVLNSARGIVATRFHALILAWVLKRQVYPICYSSKMTHTIQDLQFPGQFCEMKAIGDLDASAVLDQLLSEEPFEIEAYKAEAVKHFEKLDEL